MTDDTMLAIGEAMRARSRDRLVELWTHIGPGGDPLHRCTLAHHLADLLDDAAESLAWDIRALDAADALTDERAQQFHSSLEVRGFYPSLHLNLADDYRRLGASDAAWRHLAEARARLDVLSDDDYGSIVRAGIDHVENALRAGSTKRLPSH
jgi:hypothetical protein